MRQFERNAVIALGVFTAAALLWRPNRPLLALGVVGGGVLAGLSYWGIRAAVDGLTSTAISAGNRPKSRVLPLVKFFTRYAILALAGYGMMARLELDPIGVLIGASTPVVAAAAEAVRLLKSR